MTDVIKKVRLPPTENYLYCFDKNSCQSNILLVISFNEFKIYQAKVRFLKNFNGKKSGVYSCTL